MTWRTTSQMYDAKNKKPAGRKQGVLKLGYLAPERPDVIGRRGPTRILGWSLAVGLALGLVVVGIGVLRRRRS